MVNRHYEKKKEVKFGNGTGSPLSDHYFLSACSEINSHFNQKEESTETSIGSFFAILFCFQILGLLYSDRKIILKVRNSQIKQRKLAFFLKNIKTEYP